VKAVLDLPRGVAQADQLRVRDRVVLPLGEFGEVEITRCGV
jgi:hypothetical protein